MCGIVGYTGARQAAPLVLQGLQLLEYRGYDSAGLAVADKNGAIAIRKEAGKLENLVDCVTSAPVEGTTGIGHTRWATHGPPTGRNAHPHASTDGDLVVVHNGIVENFAELRQSLMADGYCFVSQTDTEVIVHLLQRTLENMAGDCLVAALSSTLSALQGPSAVAVLSRAYPGQIIAARNGHAGGVVIGHSEGQGVLASDLPAILTFTQQVVFLEHEEIAVISPDATEYHTFSGQTVRRATMNVGWNPEAASKGEYQHFMEKEIFEQGDSLRSTLHERIEVESGRIRIPELGLDGTALQALQRITIVACGTSYYAGLIGKHYIERLCRIPVDVDYASEFRYRGPIVDPNTLVLAISQSGETADTLAAVEEAKQQNARTAAIVNVAGSQLTRMCDGIMHMQAGPEIGVASTKAFTTSVLDLLLLGLYIAQARCNGEDAGNAQLLQSIIEFPAVVEEYLTEPKTRKSAQTLGRQYKDFWHFLYLGRGLEYPIAREGALKLKEISYIHAEGYPAGEMKHGPNALIDSTMPTVAIVPRDSMYDKMISQVEQVKARNGEVIAVTTADDDLLATRADHVLIVPSVHELLLPIMCVMPLQIFAYELATARGLDVDKPRNLAKSVTVE